MASSDEYVEDMKRFSKRYYKALREEEKTTVERARLDQALHLARMEADNNTRTAAEALQDYAGATCRSLCRKVYTTFPREVRDIIYFHLIQDKPYEINDGFCANEWPRRHTHSHLTEAAFVGKQIVRELEEVYLRTTAFVFRGDCRSMSRFRLADHLGLGLIAAHFIVNVQVHIACESFDLPGLIPDPRAQQNNGWGGWDAYPPLHVSEMAIRLENLFGFRRGSKILIDLVVDPGRVANSISPEQWLCNRVVPFIFESLRRLNQAGYNIKLRLGSDDFILQVADNIISIEKLGEEIHKMQDNLKRREEEQDAIHYSLCADNIFDLPTTQANNSSNDDAAAFSSVVQVQSSLLDVPNLFVEEGTEENAAQEDHLIEEAGTGTHGSEGMHSVCDDDEHDSNEAAHEEKDNDRAPNENHNDEGAAEISGEASDKSERD